MAYQGMAPDVRAGLTPLWTVVPFAGAERPRGARRVSTPPGGRAKC